MNSAVLLQNIEAEKGLLGTLLVNNEAFAKVSEVVGPEDFSEPAHGKIYGAISTVIGRGEQADAIRLKAHFDSDADFAKAGGARYLFGLVASVVTTINAGDYALTIRDLSMRRKLHDVGGSIQEAAKVTDIETDPYLMLDRAQEMLSEIGAGAVRTSGLRLSRDVMGASMRQIQAAHQGAPVGLKTGLNDLDSLIGGLEAGNLIIIAGRPGMGKSAVSAVIADNVAKPREDKAGESVAFFSLEMSAEQLGQRSIAARANLPLHALRTGQLSVTQLVDAANASRQLESVSLYIDDTPARTVPQMTIRARQLKARFGLALAIVDHMQLVQPTHSRGNRTEILTEISGALKAMAKTLDVPVIALSQLSRAVEQRDDKRPMLSDLRESGSIEQDADLVIFLYRDSYYLERSKPKQRPDEAADRFSDRLNKWEEAISRASGVAELIVEKQRQGPTGTVRVHYDPTTGRFADLFAGREQKDRF